MKIIKKALSELNGLFYDQEYLCLAKEELGQRLHAYLANGTVISRKITNEHLFVGYSPLIIAILFPVSCPDNITICLTRREHPEGFTLSRKKCVAVLQLKKLHQQYCGDGLIGYYEGIKGEHSFLSAFRQYVLLLNNRVGNKKPGNVYLENNLYVQVQIAYSIPRTISLITVQDQGLYNLFPTDLHGLISENFYVISLRHEGKACSQVVASKNILLTEMDASFYRQVYGLGKNHMAPLKKRDQFPFSPQNSENQGLPLPEKALRWRELSLQDSFIHGIHRIMLFRITGSGESGSNGKTLAHVHNVYATWRHKNGIKSNFLLR